MLLETGAKLLKNSQSDQPAQK